jgi:hypothetical protein
MVFEPKGPTFRPPPERSVPKGSQRIQPGTLAHDLANLDRDAVDNEIIEREELIFDIEGVSRALLCVARTAALLLTPFGRPLLDPRRPKVCHGAVEPLVLARRLDGASPSPASEPVSGS